MKQLSVCGHYHPAHALDPPEVQADLGRLSATAVGNSRAVECTSKVLLRQVRLPFYVTDDDDRSSNDDEN